MGTVVRNGRIAQDNWKLLDVAACADALPEGDVIVPLASWLRWNAELPQGTLRPGVVLAPTDDPAVLAPHVDRLRLVAVNFPRFVDGRGYSIGRQLRDACGYRGELRAIGDIQRDQIFYLSRCGFDAFALRADQDPAAALDAFADFSEAYQTAVDRPQPLFRRRAAA